METIPGVALAVYKQQRQLDVADNGYVGDLVSGYTVIEAMISSDLLFYGFIRQGNDRYIAQKDWTQLPEKPIKPWQQEVKEWLGARQVALNTRIYGVKTVLEATPEGQAFVSYPNNMLGLAEFVRQGSQVTNQVRIWKVAVVSQGGRFFLTVQKAYETTVHRADDSSIVFPRFAEHPRLHDLLVQWLPQEVELPSLSAYVDTRLSTPTPKLAEGEGIVLTFYQARGVGTVLTNQGIARVHWTDIPPRSERAYLAPGERVRYKRIDTPFGGKRMSSHKLQVYEVTVAASK